MWQRKIFKASPEIFKGISGLTSAYKKAKYANSKHLRVCFTTYGVALKLFFQIFSLGAPRISGGELL